MKNLVVSGAICNYVKRDSVTEFVCSRCKKSKVSKKYAEYTVNGMIHFLCNGCYGNLMAQQEMGSDISNMAEEENPVADALTVKESSKKTFNLLSLQEDDLKYLCRRLNPKGIRTYFQKNPKDFSKIKGGFRPASLSDEETIQLVIRYINRPFISSLVESLVDKWLLEIREFRNQLEQEGASEHESLLKALPNCVFDQNIELYFKLEGLQYSDDYIDLLKFLLTHKETSSPDSMQKNQSGDAELLSDLSTQLTEAQSALDNERSSHASTIDKLRNAEQNNEVLVKQLEEMEEKYRAAYSKTTQMQSELDGLKKLAKYADTEVAEDEATEYAYTSVCQVFSDQYTGQIWLSRLGDIEDGTINRFIRDEYQPYYFGNRDRLFWRDGPKDDGFIGVWRWNAVPNKSDPSIDYVSTAYSKGIKLIEVIELPECRTLKDITEYLFGHSVKIQTGRKLFFSLAAANGKMAGLLCTSKDFDVINGEAKLKVTTNKLPQFVIYSSEVINLAGKRFYSGTVLGVPHDIYQVRSPLAVTKDIVVGRATHATLRLLGLSKREAQHCQGFLKDMPIQDLIDEVAEAYECSRDEASTYVTDFISHAATYLEDTDIDTATLAHAVSRSPELFQRCMDTLRDEWRAENAEALQAAQAQLDILANDVENKRDEFDLLTAECETLCAQRQQISNDIEQQQTLALSVEERVAERIQAAKDNVADFICEMAFASAFAQKPAVASVELTPTNGDSGILTRRALALQPNDTLTSIEDFIDELAENLKTCGYDSASSAHMAQAITFCIGKKMPIVCGGNIEVIADCISAMFANSGSYLASLPIDSSNNARYFKAIEEICSAKHQVIALSGVFDSFSLSTFNALLQRYSTWDNLPVLLLSMSGINKEAVPGYVWERALYIDGDTGLVNLPIGELNMFAFEADLAIVSSANEFKEKRKFLKPYEDFISNKALMNYTELLVFCNSNVKAEPVLQVQLLLQAISSGKQDDLKTLFESEGIEVQNNPFMTTVIRGV